MEYIIGYSVFCPEAQAARNHRIMYEPITTPFLVIKNSLRLVEDAHQLSRAVLLNKIKGAVALTFTFQTNTLSFRPVDDPSAVPSCLVRIMKQGCVFYISFSTNELKFTNPNTVIDS